ncbi:MAG: DNA polymerase III subunit gamma/tau [Bacteroidota bacterium]
MSDYVVTARKWRPMKFEDVAGQGHITTTLRNAMAGGRLAHAYLFSGPRGVGKTTTARLLAKAVNCAHPKDQNPDNTCESCVEITEGRSFDVLEIDGASNRGIDEIRNLRESVRYAPAKGRFKVYIIDEVHMLTKEAFNALLKTLEEPPPHILFIFATTEVNKVPPTILSRCQRFDFRRIKTEDIAANLRTIALEEGLKADEGALMIIARKGDGSLRDAQSLFDQVIALCGKEVTVEKMVEALNMIDQEVYFRVTDLITAGDVKGGLALVDDIVTKGHDLKEFVSGLGEHIRNLIVARATGSTTLIEAADVVRTRYAEVATGFSLQDLLRLQRMVQGTETALRWAPQPRFKLEADMVQMITLPHAQEVGELIQRIDELKKKAVDVIPHPQVPQSPRLPVSASPGPPVSSSPRPPLSQSPGAVIAPSELSTRWNEFLGEVRNTRISLWPTLENAKLLGVEGSVVKLECPDEFQASMVMKNREALVEMFYKVFRMRPRLVTEVPKNAPTASEKEARPSAPPADDHPVIAAMKRELGAEPM